MVAANQTSQVFESFRVTIPYRGPVGADDDWTHWTPRHGAKDPLVPEHHPKWFHETIPNSKLHVFPETGGESMGEGCLVDPRWIPSKRTVKSIWPRWQFVTLAVFLSCACSIMFFCFPIAQLVYASFAHENWRNRHQEGKHNIHQKFADEFNRLVLEFFSEWDSCLFSLGLTIGWARSEWF